MQETINTSACKRLSYKRIVELVDKGADIKALSELVGVTPKTIRNLCAGAEKQAKSKEMAKLLRNQSIDRKMSMDMDR